MNINLNGKRSAELLQLYEDAARRHGEATEEGDPESGNQAHDEIVALRHELKRRGHEMLLCQLLKSFNGSVRGWAATHLLDVVPDQAVPVLEELSKEKRGYLGLGARMTLKEWHAGRLHLA